MSGEITKVDPMDPAKKNSNCLDTLKGEQTAILGEDKTRCFWNDAEYTEEDLVCGNGTAYKCTMGVWVKQSQEC